MPLLQQRVLLTRRIAAIHRLERARKSRVITLIHRQEAFSFFGLPFARYIDVENSEEIIRAIELTDPNVPIDLIIHTPGDLGADQILMAPSAVLGPVDPQIGRQPAASIIAAVERKTDINKVDDQTLILADVSKKAREQVRTFVFELLVGNGTPEGQADKLAGTLSEGRWTHDFPINAQAATELGLKVSTDLPKDAREIMSLYPQPRGRRPSVEYIPQPYGPRSDRRTDRS